jgi:transporter family-2 protein
MLQTFLTVIIGLFGGVAVGLQVPMGGAMSQRLGGAAGSFIIHLGGMLLSGVLLVLRRGENVRDWSKLPVYMLAAGVFGVILYQTINYTMPRLGSALVVTLIIIGQLLIGLLIDHFGWLGVAVHPISLVRVGGVILLIIGALMIAR